MKTISRGCPRTNGAELEFYFPAGGVPANVIDIGGDAPIPVAREGLKVLGGGRYRCLLYAGAIVQNGQDPGRPRSP